MRTLVIKPSGLPEKLNKPWRLVLRSHDLGGTDYETVALLDDVRAEEVVKAGTISWLFGEPDWAAREKQRQLEKARTLREEADWIELRSTQQKIQAPWTREQVLLLNKYQNNYKVHEHTCVEGDKLVATINGWICPYCSYTQDWVMDSVLAFAQKRM